MEVEHGQLVKFSSTNIVAYLAYHYVSKVSIDEQNKHTASINCSRSFAFCTVPNCTATAVVPVAAASILLSIASVERFPGSVFCFHSHSKISHKMNTFNIFSKLVLQRQRRHKHDDRIRKYTQQHKATWHSSVTANSL